MIGFISWCLFFTFAILLLIAITVEAVLLGHEKRKRMAKYQKHYDLYRDYPTSGGIGPMLYEKFGGGRAVSDDELEEFMKEVWRKHVKEKREAGDEGPGR